MKKLIIILSVLFTVTAQVSAEVVDRTPGDWETHMTSEKYTSNNPIADNKRIEIKCQIRHDEFQAYFWPLKIYDMELQAEKSNDPKIADISKKMNDAKRAHGRALWSTANHEFLPYKGHEPLTDKDIHQEVMFEINTDSGMNWVSWKAGEENTFQTDRRGMFYYDDYDNEIEMVFDTRVHIRNEMFHQIYIDSKWKNQEEKHNLVVHRVRVNRHTGRGEIKMFAYAGFGEYLMEGKKHWYFSNAGSWGNPDIKDRLRTHGISLLNENMEWAWSYYGSMPIPIICKAREKKNLF